ncbi:phospholipid-transporting ATPase ABCA3-like [Leguminivora glycinivorella]|uniref:phospholipid-transporting ATPase ABCA3-like n=1 Tax=Leguminivora glycinivorella TaxID=1035111 RepID=UPI00200ECCEF|nr:phospholipid-transporting ATPase ABCA3-like [Leguminivora glycinivorella]
MIGALFMPMGAIGPAINLAKRLFEEKNTGLNELQKISGVSAETISLSHVLDMLSVVLLYLLVFILYFKITRHLIYTSACHFAFATVLFFLSTVAFTFILVYVLDLESLQTAELILSCILFSFEFILFATKNLKSRPLLLVLLFLPLQAYSTFIQILGLSEYDGEAITLTNMWSITSRDKPVAVGECYLMMALQLLIFSLIAWYFSKKEYWSKRPEPATAEAEVQSINVEDKQYFETAPQGLNVGIKVNNVSKWFGEERVLQGVNLAVYRGEITVLLGHNGAGKTTLINIITGLIPASSGNVKVEGKDTFKQSVEARKLIGLCPQQNMFFSHLHVLEHVMFFAMLRGQSYSQSKTTSKELLAKLHLTEKLSSMPETLSGGMKRRVQLACALAGGARVLVLDEPTSGLDVETRRELSNTLLGLRGEHTVLMTTHFMEEADALGDRIAALHHGRVRCNASPMFLTRAIGTGHRLTLTTSGPPNEEAITRTITSVVPDATVRQRQPAGLTYNLPAKDTAQFPRLFDAIEKSRSELKIDTIGVSKSTLEEVFMELCSDTKPTYKMPATPVKEPTLELLKGSKWRVQQFLSLLQRQCRFIKPHVFIIVMILCGGLSGHVLHASAASRVCKGDDSALHALRMAYDGVRFEEVSDVHKAVFRTRRENQQIEKKYLFGIELRNASAKAIYSPSVRHGASAALNALSNLLAGRSSGPLRVGARVNRTIIVRSHPLRGAYVMYDENTLRWAKMDTNVWMWSSFMSLILCSYVSSFVRLPTIERTTGTRHAYIMAGTPRWLHWLVLYVGHASHALILIILIVLFAYLLDKDHTFNQAGFAVALFVLLVWGVLAYLSLVYFMSNLFKMTTNTTILFILVMACTTWSSAVKESSTVVYTIMYIPYFLFPPHALAVGVSNTATVAQMNGFCNLNRDKCPALAGPGKFKAEKCCQSRAGSEPFCYWGMSAAGTPMLVLIWQLFAYYMLTYVVDDAMVGRLRSMLTGTVLGRLISKSKPPEPRFNDAAVQAEAAYVQNTINQTKDEITDAVLVCKVQKSYPKLLRPPFHAVKGISFSVKKDECFGLLGVNGAGKSTTFGLLTGQMALTGGKLFANGYRSTERSKYMSTLSYCPQFGGVDGFLTGRQNLVLVLKLRGLKPADASNVAASWIHEVDLTPHADKVVSSYSGGMARRLAAAAALCQASHTAVLDEPTAGVDPIARRRMHQALLRARTQKSIIVASHSMDEMEALCHRIAIMSGGELRALGSAATLKIQHAQGYTVVFKLTSAQVNPDALKEFKDRLALRFECELKDHHRNTLRYHVKTVLPYSTLFTMLEDHRKQFSSLVDDYTVTDTTLEEVFLALAKEAKITPPQPNSEAKDDNKTPPSKDSKDTKQSTSKV